MKFIKIVFLLTVLAGFTSCLKSNHDVGGLLSDKGSILTSISETAYVNTDAQNVGLGYDHTVANFNFSKRPNESVKFFTLKISQPLQTKLSGPLVLKVSTALYDGPNSFGPNPSSPVPIPVPTGAINVTDITVPASNDKLLVVPVFFTVNKTLLDPTKTYGIKFTLTSANQGAISQGDKSVNVFINYSDNSLTTNTSDYEANYTYKSSVVDAAGVIGLNNLKTMYLTQTSPTTIQYADQFAYAVGAPDYKFLLARNFATGAVVDLFEPSFTIDANGKITGVTNASGSPEVTNLVLDPSGSNQFVYTSNNNRKLNVKYSFTYTPTTGIVTPRTVKVSDDFSYDPNQIYY